MSKNLEKLQNIQNINVQVAQATSYRLKFRILKTYVGDFDFPFEPPGFDFFTRIDRPKQPRVRVSIF